jgi:hypothetical protein
MGILPTKTAVCFLYRHAACHCEMLSTVHHLKQVQSLWNPCCAVKTKQLYYSYVYMPPLWYDFAFLGFYTSQQSYISDTHHRPCFVTECFLTLWFSNHSLLIICVKTTKLYAVKTVASHMKNMAKIYRASDSVKCKVPLLTDGASLHRGKGNTKQGNRVANSLHRNAQ